MSILKEMGIQQWRLRAPLPNEFKPQQIGQLHTEQSETETQPSSSELTPLNDAVGDAEELSLADAKEVVEEQLRNPIDTLDWQGLQALINDQQQCPGCGAGKSLLGDGDPNADWLFIADAPNSTDLLEQQIFTGRAGQLFDAILGAIGLERRSVYSSTVFKCAVSDDLSMIPNCDKILHRQIELINPKVVIAFGEFASQAVIKANDDMDVLRANEHACFRTMVPIVATYSPAQMLDNPELKADVWQDLKKCLTLVTASS